ncbi:MAG TPA: alpha/beta hydrolase [Nitrospirota bacterium]|nr:alpha/beta hydrolase [Nitrospirota bacterium]
MIRRLLPLSYFMILALSSFAADGRLITINTRPGVSVSFYYMPNPAPKATVVLLPGGEGDIHLENDVPTSHNFLVRSRDYFVANGFNVAVLNRPSDHQLGYLFRVSDEHIEDIRKTVEYLKKYAGPPVWLVGTSSGTVSAAAAAIAFGNEELAGIVLTSSIMEHKKAGAVPYQKLDAIRIPVLVLHHYYDACKNCSPGDASLIVRKLTNAPVKKLILVKGGEKPIGDPCGPLHWHGYIGMEREAVDIISGWIANPVP